VKSAAILLIVATVALGVLSSSSCFVNRVSERFVCTTSDDCDDARTCDEGYCIDAPCPSPCTQCNLEIKTCRVDCNANRRCDTLQCPAGFDCTFRCNNTNACGDIDCAAARSCEIDCTGVGSCGAINCGAGECSIECTGVGACPSIDCAASCGCDVSCNNQVACPSMSCPQDTVCRDNGAAGAPCDTSEDPILCDTCP
jgi:hypothetical protein